MSSQGIEDLLFLTLDAVSRYRVGQREAVSAALEAGGLLTEAKRRLKHGEWGDWLGRVGLAGRTASTWMKLAGLDLTAEDVIDRGGINATSQVAAEASIADTKRAYYDALSRRNAALRALAREGRNE